MEEKIYLETFMTPSDLGPNINEILLLKLKERFLNEKYKAK